MARRRKGNPVHGWVVLDKPFGLTSTQALGRVRRVFSARKAGHAGTVLVGMDPGGKHHQVKAVPFTGSVDTVFMDDTDTAVICGKDFMGNTLDQSDLF